jgi:hypothetical protein
MRQALLNPGLGTASDRAMKNPPDPPKWLIRRVFLVAGIGFEPMTFRL